VLSLSFPLSLPIDLGSLRVTPRRSRDVQNITYKPRICSSTLTNSGAYRFGGRGELAAMEPRVALAVSVLSTVK
jgi:hypothetical protein